MLQPGGIFQSVELDVKGSYISHHLYISATSWSGFIIAFGSFVVVPIVSDNAHIGSRCLVYVICVDKTNREHSCQGMVTIVLTHNGKLVPLFSEVLFFLLP